GNILCQDKECALLTLSRLAGKQESYWKPVATTGGSHDFFLNRIKTMSDSLHDDTSGNSCHMKLVQQHDEPKSYAGHWPCCKSGMIQDKGKFYGCTNYQIRCTFTLSKIVLGKTISQSNIKKLLNGQRTNLIKGFKSKKGKKFDAFLRYDAEDQKV